MSDSVDHDQMLLLIWIYSVNKFVFQNTNLISHINIADGGVAPLPWPVSVIMQLKERNIGKIS